MPTSAVRSLVKLVLMLTMVVAALPGRAADDDDLAAHMVGEALLAAHFVAAATEAGMSDEAIRDVLKDVAARSAIDEFWITDETGRAVLSSEDVAFTFDPDPSKQPQASAFWPLLEGKAEVIVQEPQKREIDDRVFRYVGVSGIDRPRIVQVGVAME